MKFVVITNGRSGSSELINKLSSKINVIPKPDNHLNPSVLLKKYGKNIKVIFITRNIKDIIKSVLQREKDKGISWIEKHYKHFNSDFADYSKIFEEDTLNFEKLYDSYIEQKIFDVLFIKYENLYSNHEGTKDVLSYFLDKNIHEIDFSIYKNEPNNLNFTWDKSLQNKIDNFDFFKLNCQVKIKDKLVICSPIKNCEKFFYKYINIINYYSNFFDSLEIVIYISNSTDNSYNLFNVLKNIMHNLHLIEDDNYKHTVNPMNIAHARNKILCYIKLKSLNPKYLLYIDVDEILNDFNANYIVNILNNVNIYDINWAYLGANSLIYYDMWALKNSFYKDNFWRNGYSPNIENDYFKIPLYSDPINVDSCGGGIGLYKYEFIKDCNYNGNTCEHLSVSAQIKNKGGGIFILPKLMVGPHRILGKPMKHIDTISKVKQFMYSFANKTFLVKKNDLIYNFDTDINTLINDLDILVISMGGSSSNFVCDYLENNGFIVRNQFWHKFLGHCYFPFATNKPIIYIYTHPIQAFNSILSRKFRSFALTNIKKLSNNRLTNYSHQLLFDLMISQYSSWKNFDHNYSNNKILFLNTYEITHDKFQKYISEFLNINLTNNRVKFNYKSKGINFELIQQKYNLNNIDKVLKISESRSYFNNSVNFKKGIKIAHLINPFKCKEDNPSYLYHAQPITFKSMHNAQLEAHKVGIDIKIYSINYPEDDEIIPEYFIKLPHLKKSTISEFPKIASNRKLPIIQEMFDSILQNSDADYIIFTNSDIGVHKNFYKKIDEFINQDNLKSFIINRRDDIPKFKDGKRLTEKDLDIIYNEKGKIHPGSDCFIMQRKILEKINMNLMFTGYPPWGGTLHYSIKKIDKKIYVYKNEHLTFHIGCDRSWSKKGQNALWLKNIEISKKC